MPHATMTGATDTSNGDALSLVRRHPRKYARATELLRVDREIKKAREEHQQAKR